jgi:hypothetical protein
MRGSGLGVPRSRSQCKKSPAEARLEVCHAKAGPLGRHGMALWDAVMREYAIRDRGGIEILAHVCGAVDVVESFCHFASRFV